MENQNIGFTLDTNQDRVVVLLEQWLAFDPEFADLVLGVIQGLSSRVLDMEKSLADGDTQLLKDQTHSLKGVTGNFQMTELYTLFLNLDTHLKETMTIDDTVENYVTLIKHFSTLIPASYNERVILPPKLDGDADVDLSILIGGQMKSVADMLIQLSYEYELNIEGAANGLEVLEKYYMDSYDLVILKENMDMLSGSEVAEEIKKSQTMPHNEIVVADDSVDINKLKKLTEELIENRGRIIEEVKS